MALIIKNRAVTEDDWIVVRANDEGALPPPEALPAGKLLLPLSYWLTARDVLAGARPKAELGIWLAAGDDPQTIVAEFDAIELIGVDFPVFRDGRGYSSARLLRERYGWRGEIRAIGDVLRDQLLYMSRCGFDAFAVREDKDIHDALRAFEEFSLFYQGAVDDPRPLFRHREAAHGAPA